MGRMFTTAYISRLTASRFAVVAIVATGTGGLLSLRKPSPSISGQRDCRSRRAMRRAGYHETGNAHL